MIKVFCETTREGDSVLIVPQSEYDLETEDFDGTYDAVWHIDIDGRSGTLCGYSTNDMDTEWFEAHRNASMKVCPECLRLEAELIE